MPSIEEVKDASLLDRESDYETDSNDNDDAISIVSISSSNSEDHNDILNETYKDRFLALKDIIPPATRLSLAKKWEKTAALVLKGGNWAGNAVWVVTTSALLVGLPLALAIEDEARIVQQEKEMQMQQSGQQSVSTTISAVDYFHLDMQHVMAWTSRLILRFSMSTATRRTKWSNWCRSTRLLIPVPPYQQPPTHSNPLHPAPTSPTPLTLL